MRIRLLSPALLVLLFLAAACAPAVPELRNTAFLHDQSLLTDQPCASPCWHNITPGVTSWSDAVAVIQDDSNYTNTQRQDSQDTNEHALSWQEGDNGVACCQLYSADGETVASIFLLLTPDQTVGQVIDKYGDPEYVAGSPISDDQALMLLVYPEKQIVVYGFVAGEKDGVLSASSEVVGVTYFAPDQMNLLIRDNNLYLWDGYKSYAAYNTGTFDHTAEPTAEATSSGG